MIIKFLDSWKKYEIGFYVSVLGLFIMGTFHLVMTCISFSWAIFNYMLFSYVMMFARISIFLLSKNNKENKAYLVCSLFLIVVLIPLCVSLVKTIQDREFKLFTFDWMVYGYAAYAFYKLIYGIVALVKSKRNNETRNVLCRLSLVNAFFTMFMLEFNLIRNYKQETRPDLAITEYVFQGLIMLFTMAVIVIFLYRYFKNCKAHQ